MRRILYGVAIAALLVTSCQKTDVLNVAEDTIDFGTQVGKLTKAEIDYSESKYATLTAQGFRVWAVSDFTSGAHTDGSIYNSMDGLDVKYNDGWAFENNAKYMWPQAGQHLYFYTMSSENTTWLDNIKNSDPFIATTDAPIATDFTTPVYEVTQSVATDDIMVADHIRQDKGTSKVVKPNFRHTMTKVEFNFVKGEQSDGGATIASTVILKSIETSTLSNKGTLKVTYSETDKNGNPKTDGKVSFKWDVADDDNKVSFTGTPVDVVTIVKKGGAVVKPVESLENETPEEGKAVVVYSKNKDGVIVEANVYESVVTSEEGAEAVMYAWATTPETHKYESSVWTPGGQYETFYGFELRTANEIATATGNTNAKYDNFKTWYMIPQDLNDEVVTITYLADGKTIVQDFQMAVNKGENDTTEDWEEESCVRYNVTIAPHKIEFKPSVDEWETNQDVNLNN